MKRKTLLLESGTLPEGYWKCQMTVNENGKIYGTGSFSLSLKDEVRKREREYCRTHRLGTTKNGEYTRIYGLNKRDYTGYCEVCKEKVDWLAYHHWDDSNYNKGIWVCRECHWLAELIDKYSNSDNKIQDLIAMYLKRKKDIENDFLKTERSNKK